MNRTGTRRGCTDSTFPPPWPPVKPWLDLGNWPQGKQTPLVPDISALQRGKTDCIAHVKTTRDEALEIIRLGHRPVVDFEATHRGTPNGNVPCDISVTPEQDNAATWLGAEVERLGGEFSYYMSRRYPWAGGDINEGPQASARFKIMVDCFTRWKIAHVTFDVGAWPVEHLAVTLRWREALAARGISVGVEAVAAISNKGKPDDMTPLLTDIGDGQTWADVPQVVRLDHWEDLRKRCADIKAWRDVLADICIWTPNDWNSWSTTQAQKDAIVPRLLQARADFGANSWVMAQDGVPLADLDRIVAINAAVV